MHQPAHAARPIPNFTVPGLGARTTLRRRIVRGTALLPLPPSR